MSAALIVAAAARDTEEERGDGDWLLMASDEGGKLRCCNGDEDVERDGGRELRSGDIVVPAHLDVNGFAGKAMTSCQELRDGNGGVEKGLQSL